jgi:hypothetical protein
VFLDERDSTRRNVERVEELRDAAIHLFISDVPNDVLGLLQACVLNYYRCLNDWFGLNLADRLPIGMMTIVFDVSPDRLDLSNAVMRRRLGKDAADYLTGLTQELRTEHGEHELAPEFLVTIKYELAIQKKPQNAALLAITDPAGTQVRTIDVPRDPARDWPWREKELLQELAGRLAPAKVGQYDVRCVVFAYDVKHRPEWFYQGAIVGSPGQYAPRFADWFETRYKQDPGFVQAARSKWRLSQAKTPVGPQTIPLPFGDPAAGTVSTMRPLATLVVPAGPLPFPASATTADPADRTEVGSEVAGKSASVA